MKKLISIIVVFVCFLLNCSNGSACTNIKNNGLNISVAVVCEKQTEKYNLQKEVGFIVGVPYPKVTTMRLFMAYANAQMQESFMIIDAAGARNEDGREMNKEEIDTFLFYVRILREICEECPYYKQNIVTN